MNTFYSKSLIFIFVLFALVYRQNPLAAQSPARLPSVETSGSQSEINSPDPNQPLITNKRQFSIPYSLGQPASSRISEVELYVSNDQGINWVAYHRQPSTGDRFFFQAAADGEYWFSMETFSQVTPANSSNQVRQAELKVVVDATKPKLSLELEPLPTGELITRWSVRDLQVDPARIRLLYQASPQLPFQTVQLDTTQAFKEQGIIAGETRWYPQATQRILLVRLEAQDRAGNVEVIQKNTPIALVAQRPIWNQLSNQRAVTDQDIYHGAPSQAANQLPQDPFLRRNQAVANRPAQIPWPSSNQPAQVAQQTNQNRPNYGTSPANSNTTNNSLAQSSSTAPALNENEKQTLPRNIFEPTSSQIRPPVGNAGNISKPQQKLPPGIELAMSNSKKFALNYSVDTVGPSGVGQVELWVTRDGGRTWKPNGIDPDRQSPFEVEVPEEGVYGFRVVVEGGNGLAGQRPQAGDLADIWVAIDMQKPIVNFSSVIYGEGPRVGELDITWTAMDANLQERPIKLFYSSSKSGPWIKFAGEVANQQKYSWKITPEVPADIYLKIEAHDKAGNIGEAILSQPIENEGLVPQGKVRSIRPIYPSTDQATLPVTIR